MSTVTAVATAEKWMASEQAVVAASAINLVVSSGGDGEQDLGIELAGCSDGEGDGNSCC